MAWYDTGVDNVTTITASIWNSLVTYLRAHKAEHITGGGDIIPVATTSKTGLCPILDGNNAHYLDGSGNWATPTATVTAVTGSAPIVSSGGTTPAISISAATTGAAGSMSSADKTKLDAIEAAADVTDAGNVNTAGAVMETDYNAFTVLAADTDNTPAPLTVGASTIVGRKASGGIVALTAAETNTILGDVIKTDYNAYSILAADVDDTPAALTVGASTIVGRKSAGGIVALTATEARTILNVADGANLYVHPNHTGDVTSTADGATVIAAKAVTLAKMNDMATASLLGRNTAATGVPEVLSATTARSILNVEDGADVTDATNVNTAGAVMETDYNAYSILAANTDNTPEVLSVPASTVIGRKSTGGIVPIYMSELSTLLGGVGGSGTGSVPTYDAIVYQDTTTTYAVDKDGNVLASQLKTDNSDNVPINAAITYAGGLTYDGKVVIATGNYHPSATINMLSGVYVFCNGKSSYFHVLTDYGNVVEMKPNSVWDGGYFYIGTSPFTTEFTSSGFSFIGGSGANKFGFDNGIHAVRNVVLSCQMSAVSKTWGGKAIDLHTTHVAADAGIYGVIIENIQIVGYWEYGLYLGEQGTNTIGERYYETISWNIFRNIWYWRSKNAIYMDTPLTYQVMDSNLFENIYIQPGTTEPWTVTGVTVSRTNNQFNNVNTVDWGSATGYQWTITAKASGTIINESWVDAAGSTVSDSGTATKWINCPGWVTEKSGRTSVTLDGSGNGTITHGLAAAPTWAIITPIEAGDIGTVTTLGATTLTIAVRKHDGSAGTTQYVNWMCGI